MSVLSAILKKKIPPTFFRIKAYNIMSLLEAPYLIEAPQMGLQVMTK